MKTINELAELADGDMTLFDPSNVYKKLKIERLHDLPKKHFAKVARSLEKKRKEIIEKKGQAAQSAPQTQAHGCEAESERRTSPGRLLGLELEGTAEETAEDMIYRLANLAARLLRYAGMHRGARTRYIPG